MRTILLFILAATVSPRASGETRLKGTVKDSSDTPFSGATVLIHRDPAGTTVAVNNVGIKADFHIRTQDDGAFSVDVPPGFYDAFVVAAFTPVCRKVRTETGEALEIAVRLDVDPLYTSEMGNRVEILPSSSQGAPFSHLIPPSYPSLARKVGIAGQARFVVEVNRDGAIASIREASSTHTSCWRRK